MAKIVTLTTDFGPLDPYAGIMKGVILGIDPGITVVDLTHGVEPGRVDQAAFLLSISVDFFPEGAVHVVVVDPTVGSARKSLAVRHRGRVFVGPDNGCLGPFAAGDTIVEITNPEVVLPAMSRTFHGRDVFAPAAAHLASGLSISKLGPEVEDPVLLDLPTPRMKGDALEAQVMHVDRFGNLVTCLRIEELFAFGASAALRFEVGAAHTESFVATFSHAAPGTLIAFEGSSGHLEIGVSGGSAAKITGVKVGDTALVKRV